MNDEPPPTTIGDLADFDGERTARFLELGLEGPKKPIDSLLDRLRAIHADAYFTDLLAYGTETDIEQLRLLICQGRASLDEYKALKETSVRLFREYRDLKTHLSATAIYFTAIAAALAFHSRKITSQTPAELETAFLDLAATVPKPWDDLYIKATEVLQGSQ